MLELLSAAYGKPIFTPRDSRAVDSINNNLPIIAKHVDASIRRVCLLIQLRLRHRNVTAHLRQLYDFPTRQGLSSILDEMMILGSEFIIEAERREISSVERLEK